MLNRMEWSRTPLDSLVIFVFVDLTVHNVQYHSYNFDLTDQLKRRINLFRYNL